MAGSAAAGDEEAAPAEVEGSESPPPHEFSVGDQVLAEHGGLIYEAKVCTVSAFLASSRCLLKLWLIQNNLASSSCDLFIVCKICVWFTKTKYVDVRIRVL